MERDFFLASLKINVPKSHSIPAQYRRLLGFDVGFAAGEFRVPEDRWDTLMASVERTLSAHMGGVVVRSLASITGLVLRCTSHGVR